jgi:hypothetical protein
MTSAGISLLMILSNIVGPGADAALHATNDMISQ